MLLIYFSVNDVADFLFNQLHVRACEPGRGAIALRAAWTQVVEIASETSSPTRSAGEERHTSITRASYLRTPDARDPA